MTNLFWLLLGCGILIFLFLVGLAVFNFLSKMVEVLRIIGEVTEVYVKKKRDST